MSIDDRGAKEPLTHLVALIEEFKQAQHRRLVKRGLALLNGVAADTPGPRVVEPFKKIN